MFSATYNNQVRCSEASHPKAGIPLYESMLISRYPVRLYSRCRLKPTVGGIVPPRTAASSRRNPATNALRRRLICASNGTYADAATQCGILTMLMRNIRLGTSWLTPLTEPRLRGIWLRHQAKQSTRLDRQIIQTCRHNLLQSGLSLRGMGLFGEWPPLFVWDDPGEHDANATGDACPVDRAELDTIKPPPRQGELW